MKKNYLIFILLIASGAWLTSCSSKKSDPAPAPVITAPVGKIDFDITGSAFEVPGGAQIVNNQIILGGTVNSKGISIIITKAATAGTYNVTGSAVGVTPDAEVTYSDGLSNDYSSIFAASGTSVGSVIITEVDQTNMTISGTFTSIVLLDDGITSISLTDGSFNKIPYTTQAANSLTAKINETLFTAGVAVGASQGGVVVVNGQAINGSQILTISVNSDITMGTYTIGGISSTINASYTTTSGANVNIFVSTQGTLVITKYDTTLKRIEGTFSFESASFLDSSAGPSITEGTFGVNYN